MTDGRVIDVGPKGPEVNQAKAAAVQEPSPNSFTTADLGQAQGADRMVRATRDVLRQLSDLTSKAETSTNMDGLEQKYLENFADGKKRQALRERYGKKETSASYVREQIKDFPIKAILTKRQSGQPLAG